MNAAPPNRRDEAPHAWSACYTAAQGWQGRHVRHLPGPPSRPCPSCVSSSSPSTVPPAPGRGPSRARLRPSWATGTWTAARCIGRSPGRRCATAVALDDEAAVAGLAATLGHRGDGRSGRDRRRRRHARDSHAGDRSSGGRRRAAAGVRAVLVERQRQMGAGGGIVMEGRDIGTVVFPGRRREGLPRRGPGRARAPPRGRSRALRRAVGGVRSRHAADRARSSSIARAPRRRSMPPRTPSWSIRPGSRWRRSCER